MLFDCFSSRIRFSPGCLTICERPISQIAWSTWESETDDACLDALFDSLPNIKERSARLNPIPGLVPDPTVVQPGCAFAPRCRYETEACKMAVPELRCMGNGHYVACSAYDDPNFKIRKEEKVDG